MTATQQCPSCGGRQDLGLLCSACTDAYEAMLAAVPELVTQLDIAASKQAKIGNGGKAGKGTIHERSPVNWGAVEARDALQLEARLWGDDVPAVRRHPMAADILSGLGKAVKEAYRTIDRARERIYLGVCMYEEDGATCHAELWARPTASTVVCSQCDVEHPVAERRAWLLQRAADQLCTVKEASEWLGEVGGIPVTQASIRGYLHRKRLAYRTGTTLIRLGDLLELMVEESGRRSA